MRLTVRGAYCNRWSYDDVVGWPLVDHGAVYKCTDYYYYYYYVRDMWLNGASEAYS